MNAPHQIHIQETITANLNEEVLIQELQFIRTRTIALFDIIKKHLTVGMNEVEARKLALNLAADFGVKKHWHQPYIRFGKGTALSFHLPPQVDNKMLPDSPFYIDLGPVWKSENTGIEYEGDYGNTFVLGENKEAKKCIDFTHSQFLEAKDKWLTEKYSGVQIYQFIRMNAERAGYKIMEDFDGHRISDFPHHKYTQDRLAQIPFTPSQSFWILELQINEINNRFGSFFEDIL